MTETDGADDPQQAVITAICAAFASADWTDLPPETRPLQRRALQTEIAARVVVLEVVNGDVGAAVRAAVADALAGVLPAAPIPATDALRTLAAGHAAAQLDAAARLRAGADDMRPKEAFVVARDLANLGVPDGVAAVLPRLQRDAPKLAARLTGLLDGPPTAARARPAPYVLDLAGDVPTQEAIARIASFNAAHGRVRTVAQLTRWLPQLRGNAEVAFAVATSMIRQPQAQAPEPHFIALTTAAARLPVGRRAAFHARYATTLDGDLLQAALTAGHFGAARDLLRTVMDGVMAVEALTADTVAAIEAYQDILRPMQGRWVRAAVADLRTQGHDILYETQGWRGVWGNFLLPPERYVPNAVRQAVRPDAAALLDGGVRGWIVVSAHHYAPQVGMLPALAIAAQDPSVRVVSVGADWPGADMSVQPVMGASVERDYPNIEILKFAGAMGAQDFRTLAKAVEDGDTLSISPDGSNNPARDRVWVPWFTAPFAMPLYPGYLAALTGARMVVALAWLGPQGEHLVDMEEVPPVPPHHDTALRAAWMIQRYARATRRLYRRTGAPLSVTMLRRQGQANVRSVARARVEEPATTVSAWLFSPLDDPGADACVTPDETVSRTELRDAALALGGMLSFWQVSASRHDAADRSFADQHRIAAIMPQGSLSLALSLGAHAAGSLYSPWAPDTPPDAMATRIREFDPHLIIATASAWARMLAFDAALANRPVLICDDAADMAAAAELTCGHAPLTRGACPGAAQPAFVIYTSGSSGAPKGVVIPRGAFSAAVPWMRQAGVCRGDRLFYPARPDTICALDRLPSLRDGVAQIIPTHAQMQDVSGLLAWLAAQRTTAINGPVSLWRLICSAPLWRQDNPMVDLNAAILWGERLSADTVAAVLSGPAGIRVNTAFGSTEYDVISIGPVDPVPGRDGSPGGRILPDLQWEVVAPETPAPEPGWSTLRVTGPDACVGYFDALWTQNPCLPDSGYYTFVQDDYLRISPDGEVTILGRSDSVVKVDARRVSLIALETTAEGVAGVTRAVAVDFEGPRGTEIRMVFTATPDAPDAVEQGIMDALTAEFFAAVQPTRLIRLKDMPLMASGKMDRAAIRAILGEADARQQASRPDVPAWPHVLGAVMHWADLRGKLQGAALQADSPDRAVPALSSIDRMELLLLAEELAGTRLEHWDAGAAFSTWRHLADQISEALR